MQKSQLFGCCAVAGCAGTALLALLPARLPAADAPLPPVTPAPASPQLPRQPNKTELDAQLGAAQQKLEQAAHEVAQLSTQLSNTLLQEVMPLSGARVIIGVQLEPGGNAGARVRDVSPGGPAAEAGIRAGDVIVALNGTALNGPAPSHEVGEILQHVKPDSRVPVRVLREGKPLEFTVAVRAGPLIFEDWHDMSDLDFVMPELPEVLVHRPLADMELATLTPRLGSYFGSDQGVLVVRAPADGALKLEDGDVILAIDGRQPSSGSHATRILRSYQPGEKVTLRIMRQHKTLDLQSTLPERSGRRERAHREAAAATDAHAPRKVAIRGAERA
jgi:C-terminal processing protease CtpA/Prc